MKESKNEDVKGTMRNRKKRIKIMESKNKLRDKRR
jgi:hypothetical protein